MFSRLKSAAKIFLSIGMIALILALYVFFRDSAFEQSIIFSNPKYVRDVIIFVVLFIIFVACTCTSISLRVAHKELTEYYILQKENDKR